MFTNVKYTYQNTKQKKQKVVATLKLGRPIGKNTQKSRRTVRIFPICYVLRARELTKLWFCWLTSQRVLLELILLCENLANSHFLHLKVKLALRIIEKMN